MFTDFEVEVLENESDVIKNFEVELPKESASAIRNAAKMAANNLFDDIDWDNTSIAITKNVPIEVKPDFSMGEGQLEQPPGCPDQQCRSWRIFLS